MESFHLNIFASYFQFVVQDEKSETEIAHLWNPQTIRDLFISASDIVGIGTVRDLTVPVGIDILDHPLANNDERAWDQIIECSITVPSGRLVVTGVTDYFPDAKRIPLEPGKYRVRILYGKLDSVSSDGLDGEDNYKLQIWKSDADDGIEFIKRWRK